MGRKALLVLLLFLIPAVGHCAEEADEGHRAVTIVNDQGEPLLVTGLEVSVGDRFIDERNMMWEVSAVAGSRAVARQVGPVSLKLTPREEALLPPVVDKAGLLGNADVAIYHTHNAEGYEPTDGLRWLEPEGSVLRAGAALAVALERRDVRTVHDETNHLPHDRMAYSRSRRTLTRLLTAHAPSVIFDVHRDTAPAAAYTTTINGRRTARLMMVIGRANPSMEATLAFAKRLKEEVDKDYPGLMRAIFFGKGHYNQDLFPRLLLLEVGSYPLTLEEAERGVTYFADAVVKVLGEGPLRRPGGGENRALWRGVLTWVAILSLFGGGFFIISNGGVEPARRKLRRLLGREEKP